jgi:hypothetical protein
MTVFVVEVNEGVVEASRQGVDWWHFFLIRHRGTDRIRETVASCIVGGKSEVACDDKDGADWLAAHMVEHGGLPRTAVRVKTATRPAATVTGSYPSGGEAR